MIISHYSSDAVGYLSCIVHPGMNRAGSYSRKSGLQHFRPFFYRLSVTQHLFVLVSLHQIDNRATECHSTDDSHISGRLIIKIEPVDVCMKELLEHQHKHRSGISDKVNRHDEEAHISLNLETSDETVEKDALKAKVSDVKAQTLNKQPRHGVKLKCIVIERHKTHRSRSGNYHAQQYDQHLDVAFYKDHHPEKK